MARTDRYEKEAPHKAGVGASHPLVRRIIIRMPIAVAAANCSPAVASCRAKYDGKFLVPMLLGALPLDHAERASPTFHTQYRHGSIT
jgi:hypothetical protein